MKKFLLRKRTIFIISCLLFLGFCDPNYFFCTLVDAPYRVRYWEKSIEKSKTGGIFTKNFKITDIEKLDSTYIFPYDTINIWEQK